MFRLFIKARWPDTDDAGALQRTIVVLSYRLFFEVLSRDAAMAHGGGKYWGNYYDLPRSLTESGANSAFGLQQLLLIAVALLLIPPIIVTFIILNSTSALRSHHHHDSTVTPGRNLNPVQQLIPTYEYVAGTEYVWQIPSDPKPKGVLFLAHGCHCRSTFFWDKHPQCTDCTGMPEERTIVLHALVRGYAVIAVSSTGDCWSSSVDTKKVSNVLTSWLYDKKLTGLPVFGLGASSGGYFLSILAVNFKFQSLVIEISSGAFEAIDFDSTYPPTLFVYMPKDKALALRILEARELLRNKGVRNDEVQCSELKVTPHFFSKRIPDLSEKVSEKIVATLHQYGYLILSHNGYYAKQDGRQSGWKMALRKGNVLPYDDRLKWERSLEEEMNLAYAYHEFTSMPYQDIFQWFESSSRE